MPVGPLTCWVSSYPFTEHEPEDARRLAEERNRLLDRLRKRTLHDFDREQQPYFSRSGPLEKGFAEEAARWREEARAFGSQAHSLRTTINRVAERYFEGSPLLLDEEQQELKTLVELWERPLGLFNDLVVGELARVAKRPQVARLELAELQAAGEARSVEQTAYLVDCAKAETLKDMREEEAAVRLMEKYV